MQIICQIVGKRSAACELGPGIITARKRSLRRLCFYTCLLVLLFTGGGVCIQRGWADPPPILVGSVPILSVSVNISIDTMLKFDATLTLTLSVNGPFDVQKSHDNSKLRNDDVSSLVKKLTPKCYLSSSQETIITLIFWEDISRAKRSQLLSYILSPNVIHVYDWLPAMSP